jgi:hypothetical protein
MRTSRIKRACVAFTTACLTAVGAFAAPAALPTHTAAVAEAQTKPSATFKKGAEVWTKRTVNGKPKWFKTKLAGFDKARMAGYIQKK